MANVAAYGLFNRRDVADRLITEVGVGEVFTAIDQTLAQHNAEMNAMMSLFVRRTTDFQLNYRTPATNRLQALDEIGRALPVKGGGVYQVEWPLLRAGTAWGYDYETNLKMTVQQAAEQNDLMMTGDIQWMREQMLAALFANVDWTWADVDHGSQTIHGLANGDAVTYLRTGGRAAATATHYLGQANSIGDASGDNPYPTIASTLKQYPDNSGEIIALIPTNLRADTEDLATFRMAPDPNVRAAASDEVLVGRLGVTVPGEIIGYADGVWIVEWPSLPDSRIIAVTSGGERPLAMREDPLPALQGFNRVGTREDFPFTEFQYRRQAGFGAWNRVGALVFEIGDATYDVPTGFAEPLR